MKKTVYGFIMAVALVLASCDTPNSPGGGGTEQLPPGTGIEDSNKFYDANGWHKTNPNDMHNYITNSDYAKDGWSRDSWNINGSTTNRNGSNVDDLGYDRDGWQTGYPNNKYTGTQYNKEGYDRGGHNQYGFDKNGNNKTTGTSYDKNGFKKDGTFGNTGSPYCNDSNSPYYGLDRNGYDTEGWYGFPAVQGYNPYQYSASATPADITKNRNGTYYADNGKDIDSYDKYGWNLNDLRKH
jgi:hypothetical protein